MKISTITNISLWVMGIAMIILAFIHVHEGATKVIIECYEVEEKKYREEGTLFGTQKVITHDNSATFDGYVKICLNGLNYKGEYIRNDLN